MKSSIHLGGRSIVLTGASSGIGLHLANRLLDFGAEIIGISRSQRPSNLDPRVRYIQMDLSEEAEIRQIGRLMGKDSVIDGLVNAAGISIPIDEENKISYFRKTIDTNLVPSFILASELKKNLQLSSSPSIVNITSINSTLGFPNNPAYVASKAGLAGLTRAQALDFARYRIRVNSIAPGYFPTKMTEKSFQDPDLHYARRSRTMLDRWGSLEDLVGPTVWLLSDCSLYVTGQEIPVDGGWTTQGLSTL
jgi:NAD(P)-dependent dehydrogenase (short-subunit alcohol dehydrogenase family)